MKAVNSGESQMQNLKRKIDKTRLMQFRLFFYKLACLLKTFNGRVLPSGFFPRTSTMYGLCSVKMAGY